MPVVADETEEEKKLREEQEAAQAEMEQLLATRIAPPDVPDAMAAPESALPIGSETPFAQPSGIQDRLSTGDYTTDSPRYAAEVARAQRGNGFLNADVGPAGNTIVPGYDPSVAEAAQRHAQAKLAAQAERFMGVQGYQQSLKSGATPAEALALWGQKMFAGDPKGLVNLATRREPLPRVVPPQRFMPGKMTPGIAAESDDLRADLRRQESALAKGTKAGVDKFGKKTQVPLSPEEVAGLEANIGRIKGERKQLLSSPEINPNVDQRGFQAMKPAWDAAGTVPRPQVSAPTKQEQKDLTVDAARDLLKAAGGDKAKARKMALDAGYRL